MNRISYSLRYFDRPFASLVIAEQRSLILNLTNRRKTTKAHGLQGAPMALEKTSQVVISDYVYTSKKFNNTRLRTTLVH